MCRLNNRDAGNTPRRALLAAVFGLAAALGLGACTPDTGLAIGEERVQPDEAAIEAEMVALIRAISLQRRQERNDTLVRRFNQPKTVACLQGTLRVGRLDPQLAVGMFATPGHYPAVLRFANATEFDDREQDLRGLSMHLEGVPGAVAVDGTPGRQDFTFNSYPALFAGTPQEFLEFVRASASDDLLGYFLNPLNPHLKALWIVLQARDNPDTPLQVRYYSTTPYAWGEHSAVKYAVRACSEPASATARAGPDYLRRALARDLSAGPQCLALLVQFQSDPDLMPIEDASVVWSEDVSPYREVAQVLLAQQDFQSADALAACEALQFNPWNTHPAHRPLGGINRMRQHVYAELGAFRAGHNRQADKAGGDQ